MSRQRSAKALRLICSPFMATSVKIIWSCCTPLASASERYQSKIVLKYGHTALLTVNLRDIKAYMHAVYSRLQLETSEARAHCLERAWECCTWKEKDLFYVTYCQLSLSWTSDIKYCYSNWKQQDHERHAFTSFNIYSVAYQVSKMSGSILYSWLKHPKMNLSSGSP